MPEIAPATPLVPAAPAATPIAGVAPSTSGYSSGSSGTDAPTSDFFGQLTAALKGLTSSTTSTTSSALKTLKALNTLNTLNTLTSLAGAVAASGQAVSGQSGATGAADQHQPAAARDGADPHADDLSQLLAMLGLVPVPATLPGAPVVDAAPTGSASALPAPGSASDASPAVAAIGPGANAGVAAGAPADGSGAQSVTPGVTPTAAATESVTQSVTPAAADAAGVTPQGGVTPSVMATSQSVTGVSQSVSPVSQNGTGAASVTPKTATAAAGSHTRGPDGRHAPQTQPQASGQPGSAPTTTADINLPQALNGSDQSNGGSAFQSSADSNDGRHQHTAGASGASKTASQDQTATGATPDPASVSLAAAAGAASTSATSAASQSNVHPGDVVAQIAHQADLYRLPGNKGVRIQLHPDDLGGVQVTLRYAAGGNLELHINVEHASTGALVEAGWGQLRDALATLGFSPERLVMSVTAPSAANQMDSSSNNQSGSYRSDSGLASFMQDGQSGQSRDHGAGPEDARALRGWSSTSDSAGTSDDSSRAATSGGAATSRIDYRV